MKLCFDSIDEVQAFVKQLKGTRGKKGEDDSEVGPTPVGGQPQMPTGPAIGFTPPQTAMQGFPGAVPTTAAVNPLVPQIIAKLDGALASGQNAEQITTWFRNLLGPDAAAATLDQIKQVFIPRLPEPQLKQLAQQVGIAVT
jgi:hypothetical protein